jgi:ferric-dicitrate binding protein FerR (iron transport regulator)
MGKQPDISALAEKWLNGTISEEEKQQFEEWYNRQPGASMDWLKDETEDELKKRIFRSVIDQMEEEQPVVRRVTWKRKLSAAAAVLLLLGGAAAFLLTTNRTEKQTLAGSTNQEVIAPSGTKATLTLADGTEIALGSSKNGVIALQGNMTIRKMPDGQIVYDRKPHAGEILYNTITVPRGSELLSVVLSDGSKVLLNVESTLRYPVTFDEDERQVSVTGEAYFEVSKDASRPFEVEADGVKTAVLGTHFNVNTYRKQVLVTLLEGAVEVSNDSEDQLLQPGQQADAGNTGAIVLNKTPDMEAVMAWKSGLFKLDNSDIYTVMDQLARWYDVDVQVEDGMEGRQFSGLISRNTDLATVLNMLSMTKEVSFRREGRTVIVSPYR